MNFHAIDTDCNTTLHITGMAVRAHGAGLPDAAVNLVGSIPTDNQRLSGAWTSPNGIRPLYPYTLFNKSPLQLRRIGALGGKAHGRNQRARRALMPAPPAATPLGDAPQQSTAEAIAALNAQFPWLCCAEKRRSRNQPPNRLKRRTYRTAW